MWHCKTKLVGSFWSAFSIVIQRPIYTFVLPISFNEGEGSMRSANLILQFCDDFNKEYGPPDYFDLTRWTKWMGDARTEGGYGLIEALRPGAMTFAGFAAREKYFNPALAGTNGVEITLVDYTHEEYYPRELEDQVARDYIMGWGLTVANWRGQMGGQKDHKKDRGVQLHIDLMRKHGLYVSLVRGIVPDDWDKYPNDGLFLETAVANGAITPRSDLERYGEFDGLNEIEWRAMQDKLVEQGAFIIIYA